MLARKHNHSTTRRGDTMIEVMFGVAIFGLIAISSIGLMNNGLATSETNLEDTLARNEINAQAEALRFIHSSYTATGGSVYNGLWQQIVGKAADSFDASSLIDNFKDGVDCNVLYNNVATSQHSFALNTDSIRESGTFISDLRPAEHNNSPFPYPTINNNTAYGVWINAIKSSKKDNGKPYYYDFYVRACWHTTSSNTPTILDTVVRLYNPDRRSS